jgi:hypothetical protein
MLCTITLRFLDKVEIIHSSNNFNEIINELEHIVRDKLIELRGTDFLNKNWILKDKSLQRERGYFCTSELNKLIIWFKNKDGWFYSGYVKKFCEYELLYVRKPSRLHRRVSKMDKDFSTSFLICLDELVHYFEPLKEQEEVYKEVLRKLKHGPEI